jgi:hypothetical protein
MRDTISVTSTQKYELNESIVYFTLYSYWWSANEKAEVLNWMVASTARISSWFKLWSGTAVSRYLNLPCSERIYWYCPCFCLDVLPQSGDRISTYSQLYLSLFLDQPSYQLQFLLLCFLHRIYIIPQQIYVMYADHFLMCCIEFQSQPVFMGLHKGIRIRQHSWKAIVTSSKHILITLTTYMGITNPIRIMDSTSLLTEPQAFLNSIDT